MRVLILTAALALIFSGCANPNFGEGLRALGQGMQQASQQMRQNRGGPQGYITDMQGRVTGYQWNQAPRAYILPGHGSSVIYGR